MEEVQKSDLSKEETPSGTWIQLNTHTHTHRHWKTGVFWLDWQEKANWNCMERWNHGKNYQTDERKRKQSSCDQESVAVGAKVATMICSLPNATKLQQHRASRCRGLMMKLQPRSFWRPRKSRNLILDIETFELLKGKSKDSTEAAAEGGPRSCWWSISRITFRRWGSTSQATSVFKRWRLW